MNPSLHALALALLSAAGCATRSVPTTFPAASSASADAPEAPRVPVARTLEGDPPLPGAPSSGWEGLDPIDETATPAATFTCPMHPEVTSDREGRCPKCGMNLEPKR